MKALFLFSLLLVASWTSNAATEILEATDLGRTHIDPVSMSTFINYKTDYQYDKPKVTYASCKTDSAGKPISNYFIIKKLDAKGVMQNFYIVKSGLTCDEIKKNDTGIANCEEHSALEFTISDPKECAEGKCPKLSTPRVASVPLNINLHEDKKALHEQINKCSPERQLILIKDSVTGKSLIASLADKSHCKLDKRRIETEGGKWDDGDSPITQIHTSPRSGFFIGEHTHYYFDETKKEWCIHFRPDLGSTAPSCGYNNMTRSIAFALPGEDQKSPTQKGVVKLTYKDGVPKAEIGNAASSEYSKSPPLDENGPILEVSFSNKDGEGRKTLFKSKKGVNGTVSRTITVSPTYSLGTKIAEPKSCDKNACLSGPKEVIDADSQLQCTKNATQPFTMPTASTSTSKDMCYSCNGVTSGPCGDTKVLLDKNNLSDITTKLNACRATDASPSPAESTPGSNAEAEPE